MRGIIDSAWKARCLASCLVALTAQLANARTTPGIVVADGNGLFRDGKQLHLAGFNYYPRDFAWRMWENYTSPEVDEQIDTELDKARMLGLDTVRIFVRYSLFRDQSSPFLVHLQDFVNRAAQRDLLVIVTLFDFYAGDSAQPYSTDDYVNAKLHITAVVTALGSENPAVLAWDLRNEPESDFPTIDQATVESWAEAMIAHLRSVDPNHLITVGHRGTDPADDAVFDADFAVRLAPIVDVVSVHYFLPETGFYDDLETLRNRLPDKPLLVEEYGLYSLSKAAEVAEVIPHTELQQAAYYNAMTAQVEALGLAGDLLWTLNDFSTILEGDPQSERCFGILRNRNASICDGDGASYSEKPAAGVVARHAYGGFAFLDDFDGPVDPKQGGPAPGWSHNFETGGLLMQPFDPDDPERTLWSHHPGRMGLSKYVQGQTSVTGMAASPLLERIDTDAFPFLRGEVSSYDIHDKVNGSDSVLHVSVEEDTSDGPRLTRLLTVEPETPLPLEYGIDLREGPTGWTGEHSFRVVFELEPRAPANGYSATYEVDYVGVGKLPPCSTSETSDCFDRSRFQVAVAWHDSLGNQGVGHVVPGGTDDSGLIWFFGPENWELLLKVLDGCAVNGRFWVFAAATTNVEYTLTVTDTLAAQSRAYVNPLGALAQAITDTNALATCAVAARPSSTGQTALLLARPTTMGWDGAAHTSRPVAKDDATPTRCETGSPVLCLQGREFEATVDWKDFAGQEGEGYVVRLRSDSSGLFSFFAPDNWELLVKVLDACALNGRFWVFSAATTNVEYTLRVRDAQSGQERTYFNHLGVSAPAVADTDAFTCAEKTVL